MSYATATPCKVAGKDLTYLFLSLILIGSVATTQSRVFRHEADIQRRQRHGMDAQCPAGEYLKPASIPNTTAVCMPCHSGIDFTEYPNGLPSCIPCQICKPDQEEVMPCNATRNTQCRCKSGTFCPKDHPCEICKRCKSKCPRGMVEVSSCSHWSDLECTYPLPSDTRSHWITASLVIVVVLFFVVVVFGILSRCTCAVSGADNSSLRNPLDIKHDYHPQHPEAWGNEHPESDHQRQANSPENQGNEYSGRLEEVITTPKTTTMNGYHPGQAEAPQVNPKSLFPADGDHIKTLEKSFFIFEQIVPWDCWNQYMRQLGLSQNEIQQARAAESNVKDQPNSMLMAWLNKTGKEATMDRLLQTLDKIHQRAARETIHDELIKSKLYVYQKREDEKPN
ncbi:tumor necrosis factor receptor superfamily member 10A-like isoform X2 [Vombatus ursinus]|uniref:tumor necrosis factor receptor superfamily member 10A-like isoform X2 n=1 Tax=Vombatus ursinus TaxID=29139 RepID=UPI000FFD192D|nr:tumor necrosis factor receptor superfamily member 10A-like isoform X2 [Vombatus ursinus]